MYDFLKGRLVERTGDEVVLENAGIGYRVNVAGTTAGRLPEGVEITLYVHDMLRDERTVLYGFACREERALFLRLLSVNRIGPGIALTLLSALEPALLVLAVQTRDVKALARVKGVGQRTAERLCVELKDRLLDIALPSPAAGGASGAPRTDARSAVASALAALGYQRSAALRVADAVCSDAPPGTPLELLVKQALRELAAAPAAADPPG